MTDGPATMVVTGFFNGAYLTLERWTEVISGFHGIEDPRSKLRILF